MALSAARNTPMDGPGPIPGILSLPVKASTTIYAGGLVALSAGYVVPASADVTLIVIGRAASTVDNSSGSSGDLNVKVDQGVFRWDNSGSGDAIAQADVGKDCYAVSDSQVAKTSNTGARPVAGRIVAVDSSGVWVESYIGVHSGAAGADQFPVGVIAIPVDLVSAANAGIAATITPGFAGRIKKVSFQTTVVTSTGSKAGTLTPKIGSTAVTGGVVVLASNTDTGTLGANKAGTAVTAANLFGATDTITVVWSSVTAFVEGAGVLFLHLG